MISAHDNTAAACWKRGRFRWGAEETATRKCVVVAYQCRHVIAVVERASFHDLPEKFCLKGGHVEGDVLFGTR